MAKKSIVVVLGSPRRDGNSAALAEQTVAGAETAGAEVETFYLHGMDVAACTACDACRDDSDKDCVIDDDMATLYPKVRAADAVVFASPIYWFAVSAQMKLFMDRCYALGGPKGNALKGKQIGILLTYADPDPFISGAGNALRMFQDGFRYIGSEIAGMVYGSALNAGEIRSNKALMKKAYELGTKLGGVRSEQKD